MLKNRMLCLGFNLKLISVVKFLDFSWHRFLQCWNGGPAMLEWCFWCRPQG